VVFFLNNCGKEDFSQIPYAKIRMFEGSPTRVREVFASYNVAAEPQFKGRRALILGRLYRKAGEWRFAAIGDVTEDVFVGQTVARIASEYHDA
jgi:tellurium resistance protein TerZ